MSDRDKAKQQIKVGATYRHRGGYKDVVVTDFCEVTGRVSWRQASGPGPGDHYRNLDCEDFLTAYALRYETQGRR
ncbi:hypothetical protein ACF1DY_26330 [Streptomyces albus]